MTTMRRMTSVALALMAGAVTMTLLGGEAWADCNPACTGRQVCRYEAAGDYFYCANPPTGGGNQNGGTGGGRWTRSNVHAPIPQGPPGANFQRPGRGR